ncbi:hypothetical protein [Natrarchaeobaculum sulfurireducens]|uniref:Uncharacterized protein n=1 Tax=Natrarchaeobaculum sulfurireducens TaxID=2044521 RepID=A0A346PJL7_9EURY|nr:hypothetical protein [Natrarchaeobaculum sulfurireducens]AXR79712.1 hypothetical protein AArc1_3419 [Natrarchaeobaculum sulfurireducens]
MRGTRDRRSDDDVLESLQAEIRRETGRYVTKGKLLERIVANASESDDVASLFDESPATDD